MSVEIFKDKFEDLESIWQLDENGVEFIYARDLQKILGYEKWQKFEEVIKKAIISCESNKHKAEDHFTHAGKLIEAGKGAKREVQDYKLTRYACYLTAQNGDPRKEEIAFAQNYFAVQTRNFELVMQRKEDFERVLERYELKEAEKIFSEELYQRGIDAEGFARVRSKGDAALFGGNNTQQMKEKLGVPEKYNNRPLADFLNPALITAKKLAIQISNIAIKEKNLLGEEPITTQHNSSNQAIRDVFVKETGLKPEELPMVEDIKKVESRLKGDLKSITKSVNNQ
ncbi:MAG: DNA damage-inducible protein D [Alphaproteobacteria bacterium]|jgi:DNA-damage-inducible protein D|nr:DNA damage-inducible protein D [Alphaproteobacteria bacterium]